jgi:hypothetical protein
VEVVYAGGGGAVGEVGDVIGKSCGGDDGGVKGVVTTVAVMVGGVRREASPEVSMVTGW